MYCIKRKQSLFFIGMFYMLCKLSAQENLTGYWQPQLSLNYEVAKNYSHNFSLAKRSYVFRDETFLFDIRQLDLVHFSKLKVSGNQSLGFGIQYRFRETFEENRGNELRLTQQYNITNKIRSLRLGNRFRAEQRITATATIHRFRYRLALDFPLQGESLDIGESYAIITTEALLSTDKGQSSAYDQRLTTQLGWLISDVTKFQIGTEFRAENYSQSTEYVFFLLTGLVLSL
ncbi:DUF2490 domain-containing protein [Maribacter sp. 2210JD10-5]|uniref:DUF2490 domain-containing protein n=1 Tax=Maribacter sp. 2210JD10-5 TaxID=3386272 RepID=UPI0039BC8E57